MTMTHVLFDFFGTLVAYSESRTEQGFHEAHALVRACCPRLEYLKFLEQWDSTFGELEARAQLTLDEYSMDAVCAAFFRRILGRLPDQDTLSLFRDTYLREWNQGVVYLPGLRDLLSALARRFTLVLVTNTHHTELVLGHLREMNIASCFSGIFTSIDHGRRKPSPSIFERALSETGGSAASAAYVGDSFAADYCGATGAGLRCLLIDPQRRCDIPEQDRVIDVFEAAARLAADLIVP